MPLCLCRLLPLPGMPFCTQMAPTHSLKLCMSLPLGKLSYPHYCSDRDAYLLFPKLDSSWSSISLPGDSSKLIMVILVSWRCVVRKWACEPMLKMKRRKVSWWEQGETSEEGFWLLNRASWKGTAMSRERICIWDTRNSGSPVMPTANGLWGLLANWEGPEIKWTWVLNAGILPDSGLVVLDNKSPYLNQCLLAFSVTCC